MTEPSQYLTCASLHELCAGWPADRPVWIQSRGGALERVQWADHLERGADGGEALVLRSWAPGQEPTATCWLLEWATPAGQPVPATTLHRTEAGARAVIADVAAEIGAEPVAEETRPGGMVLGWLGETAWMLRQLRLED